MAHSFAALYCHIVFSTKNREPYIESELQQRLYDYMGGIVGQYKSVLCAAGGIADHVHLLVSLARDCAVSDLVREVKSGSSAWVHDTFPSRQHFAWQAGYGVFSVSVSRVDGVKRYIARQESHHRKQSFQEEYRRFLEEHGIEFDERYVWE